MSFLKTLTKEDIKAIAGSRYAKRVGNKLLMLICGLVVVGLGGAVVSADNIVMRWGLCIVTMICVIIVAVLMDKGQKREREKLIKEWEAEKKGVSQ